MNDTVTPLQHWLCNGQKQKQDWNHWHRCCWRKCSPYLHTLIQLQFLPLCSMLPLCPCSFPFFQSPPFFSVSCRSRAELLACLWGVERRGGGGRLFLWVSESVYQESREGRERLCPWLHLLLQLPLLSGQGHMDFPWQWNHISWGVGSWWQEGERPLLPHSSLKGTDPFSKRFFAMWYSDMLRWCGVNSISVCIRNIRRHKYIP